MMNAFNIWLELKMYTPGGSTKMILKSISQRKSVFIFNRHTEKSLFDLLNPRVIAKYLLASYFLIFVHNTFTGLNTKRISNYFVFVYLLLAWVVHDSIGWFISIASVVIIRTRIISIYHSLFHVITSTNDIASIASYKWTIKE